MRSFRVRGKFLVHRGELVKGLGGELTLRAAPTERQVGQPSAGGRAYARPPAEGGETDIPMDWGFFPSKTS